MIDREKVFDAFRNCITEPKCKDCPWEQCELFNQKKVSIPATLALDVLNLLKEQETTMVIESENMYTGLPTTHCPKCGVTLDRFLYGRQHEGQINYCPMCGQAIKWE